jgi:hypothetical protein
VSQGSGKVSETTDLWLFGRSTAGDLQRWNGDFSASFGQRDLASVVAAASDRKPIRDRKKKAKETALKRSLWL